MAEIKAKQDEAKTAEADRAKDLEDRRRMALAEAEAIRAMMAAPKKVMVAKKPEEAKPAVDAKAALKGTLHKPAGTPTKPGQAATAPAGGKKEVKSEALSSTWKDDAAKKKELKTRGDTGAGRPGGSNWRAGAKGGGRRGGRRGDHPHVAWWALHNARPDHSPVRRTGS